METQQHFMFKSASPYMYPGTYNVVYHDDSVGFWAQQEVIVPLLPAGERAQYLAACEGPLGFDEHFDPEPVPVFRSLGAVMAWIDAIEELDCVAQELRAYHAPSECGVGVIERMEAAVEAAEAESTGMVPIEMLRLTSQ